MPLRKRFSTSLSWLTSSALAGGEPLLGRPGERGASGGGGGGGGEPATPDYADIEAGLMDPNDAATLMDDDDLSLWDAPESAYRDDDDDTLPAASHGVAHK